MIWVLLATYASLDLLTGPEPQSANAEGWKKAINIHLRNWWHGVPGLEEEGLISPTRAAVDAAIKISESLAEQSLEPPSRIVPNGEGGLVFERYPPSRLERTIEKECAVSTRG